MKKVLYLVVIAITFSACQKKNSYSCKCVSVISGQELNSYPIEAKNSTEASAECYSIQNKHVASGAKTLDCAVR